MSKLNYLKFILIILILFANGIGLFLMLQKSKAGEDLKFWGEAPEVVSANEKKTAYISGAVKAPGVYLIESDMRIADLVFAAGGFEDNADNNYISSQLNLAKKVVDEKHVFIPSSEAILSNQTNVSSDLDASKLDLNEATIEQLMKLDGVGPATAEKIIAARPYSEVQQLLGVSGIGESTFAQLESKVTVNL